MKILPIRIIILSSIGLLIFSLFVSYKKMNLDKKQTSSHLEIDVFSGMPNPTCMIPEEESTRIVSLIGRLDTTKSFTESNALGYRGIILFPGSDTEHSYYVSNGFIYYRLVNSGANNVIYIDKNSFLEGELVIIAKKCLSPEISELIKSSK